MNNDIEEYRVETPDTSSSSALMNKTFEIVSRLIEFFTVTNEDQLMAGIDLGRDEQDR